MRTLWGSLLLVFGLILPGHPETFRNPHHISIPSDPARVGTADFNGDGRPDFYYVDASGLNVMLTKSDGSDITVGPVPNTAPIQGIAVVCNAADLNGDGFADAVCFISAGLQPIPATATVFLGKGDGTFQQSDTTYISGSQNANDGEHELLFVAFADINSDGHPDILFQDNYTGYLYTWFGDGTGHFQAVIPYLYATGGSIGWGGATIVDLNEDGHPDLAFANGPLLLLGKGDGTFDRTGIDVEQDCHFADIDKDGHIDAYCARVDEVSTTPAYILDVLHGNGNGTFNPNPIYSVSYPYKDFVLPVAARDLNGDGYLDIIGLSEDSLVLFFGKSGSQFSAPVHYSFYPAAQGFSGGDPEDGDLIADYDLDGHVDLATTGVNGVYITYGRSDGTFDAPRIVQSGTYLDIAAVADFNEDGTPDVLTSGSVALQLNTGKGDGSFAPSMAVQTPTLTQQPISVEQLFAGDFNGDGHKDILFAGQTADNPSLLHLFPGRGDGTFGDPVVTNVSTLPTYEQISSPVDINGDGRDDLLSAEGNAAAPSVLSVFLSDGDGTFTVVPTSLPSGGYGLSPAAADFNKDGKPDVVVPSGALLQVLLGHGDGSFDVQPTALVLPKIGVFAYYASVVATGDFDHDGNPDVAALGTSGAGDAPSGIFVYYGDGHGGFAAPVTAATLDRTYGSLQASDLNGDGLLDFVATSNAYANAGPSSIAVVHGQPGRTFGVETDLIAGTGLTSPAIADFNRDGQPDIFVANINSSNSFVVLQNQGATTTTLTSSANPSILGQSVTFTATVSVPPSLTVLPSVPSTITLAGLPGDVVTIPVTFASSGGKIVGTATYQISSLPVGSHPLTASFSGNSEINASTSATLTQVVNPDPSYGLAASQTSLGVTAGDNTNNWASIYVRAFNGFAGTVKLACSITSQDGSTVSNPPACSFDASTLTLHGADVTTRLVVTTMARTSAIHMARESRPGSAWDLHSRKSIWLCGVFLLILPMRFRSRGIAATRLLLALVCALTLAACGSTSKPQTGNSSGSGTGAVGTPAGNYSITISAASNTPAPAPAPIIMKLIVE